MQNRQSNPPTNKPRSFRLLGLVLCVVAAMVASGLAATPAQAQPATQFVFEGAGWGHGVGMSQNGARNMADSGIDHVGILNHYYPNTIVSKTTELGNIRVHIGDAGRVELSSAGSMVFERGGVAINSLPSGTISVAAHENGLQIGNAWTTGTAADPVFVSFPMPVKLANNGHTYLWGKLQLTNRNGKVRVVEVLPLEDYVAGISEMPAAWPLEALMAQAIAARTYAHEVTLHRRNSDEWAQEYDISGTTVDQNYIGWDAQDSAWDQKWLAAVSATAGVEIVDNSGPIRAYYSASNGGYTETASYVFGNDVAYTVAAPDPFDAGGHDWTTWTRTYSQEAMSRWLNASEDTSVGVLSSIELLGGAGASARIDKAVVELRGSGGIKRVTGKRLMLVINAGVFGEGGGLSTHLPGTFTTIGNGVSAGAPKPGGVQIPASVTPDPVAEDADENRDFVPPPGWKPEPGTGVPPGAPEEPASAGDGAASDDGVVLPDGYVPEPGTGVPPGAPEEPASAGDGAASDDGVVLPDGYVPEPGTGVPPGAPEEPASAGDGAASDDGVVLPDGYVPEPGTGVPPGDPEASLSNTSSQAAESAIVLPEGYEPEPGTGIPPEPTQPTEHTSLASTVLLVTRGADDISGTEAEFRVIAPTDELAEEARERLRRLQTDAALGLFANIDIDGYVAAVAPRPVHGICTATDAGVTCVPLATLQRMQSVAEGTTEDE